MPLITDPSVGNGKLMKILTKYTGLICVTFYVSGIIWFLALAHRYFNNGCYFSENALLPGLVQGEFDEDITAQNLQVELKEVMQKSPNEIPHRWLFQKFSELSMDAYLHNFTLNYPLSQNISFKGQNFYSILRAPRAASIEGLIVTAPFRKLTSAHPDNSASIAILIALAKFCRKHKYWAKDIVFLIGDHEQLGTQVRQANQPEFKLRRAWLEAYHNLQLGNGILDYGSLDSRAGSIQAAINLEFHSTRVSHVDVKIEGLNGQLPNLDMFNLVHRLCQSEGVRHTFKNRSSPRKKDTLIQQWFYSLTTLLSMVLTQASCVPNGNHGLYHRFGIEAITLEGHEPPANYRKQVAGLHQVGRVLEGVLRSLNNLLERFHQSYFFYLLTSYDRFISIGSYMPSVSLIGAPLLIEALTIWLKIYTKIKPKNKNLDKDETSDVKSEDKKLSFRNLGLLFLISHLIGWLFTNTGPTLSKLGFDLAAFSPTTSIYCGYFAFYVLSTIIYKPFKFSLIEVEFVNVAALLELATLLLIIAMHNFSLSLILSTIYVPCVCFISSKFGRLSSSLKSVYMLLTHPFALVHLIVLGYTYVTHGEENFLSKAFFATEHSYVYFIMDDMIYGNWFLRAVFGFLVPNWILFWTVLKSYSRS